MIVYDVFKNEFIDDTEMDPIAPPERYIVPQNVASLIYFASKYLAQQISDNGKENKNAEP